MSYLGIFFDSIYVQVPLYATVVAFGMLPPVCWESALCQALPSLHFEIPVPDQDLSMTAIVPDIANGGQLPCLSL